MRKSVSRSLLAIIAAGLAVGATSAGAAPKTKIMKAGSPPSPVTALPANCTATPWALDNNSTNHVTALPNTLGKTVPSAVTIYFSPGGDSSLAYPVEWNWGSASAGNPVTIEMTANRINLHIFSGAPLHGMWDAQSGQWRVYTTGYWLAVTCG